MTEPDEAERLAGWLDRTATHTWVNPELRSLHARAAGLLRSQAVANRHLSQDLAVAEAQLEAKTVELERAYVREQMAGALLDDARDRMCGIPGGVRLTDWRERYAAYWAQVRAEKPEFEAGRGR